MLYGPRTSDEMFRELKEHLHCTTQAGDGEPHLPAVHVASWEGQGNVVEVALVCDACHQIVAGLTFSAPGDVNEIDCWNPNCGNKAESEDSLTCADCTSARETTDADICVSCTCWVDAAFLDQNHDPHCEECYEG